MKKVLLLISASLASFSLSFAQAPLEMLQRSDNDVSSLREGGFELPKGFTYADRDSVSQGNVGGVGIGSPYLHIATVLELPTKVGQVIKGITYLARTEDKHGKIFIASRHPQSEMEEYTIEQVKDVETQVNVEIGALTTAEFDTPVTTEEGKIYAVGYEVKSSGEKNSPTTFPIMFAGDTEFFKEANLVSFRPYSIGDVGQKIKLIEVSEKEMGNVVIVVQGENLASTFGVASELLPFVYSQDGRILIDGAFDSFVVFDASGRLVANNSDTMLPAGTYIVKARTGSLDSVSKVVVK